MGGGAVVVPPLGGSRAIEDRLKVELRTPTFAFPQFHGDFRVPMLRPSNTALPDLVQ